MRAFLSMVTDIVNGPFRYREGPKALGVGTTNLALEQPARAIDADYFSPRYNVRRSMEVKFPTFQMEAQSLPATDLRASGLFLSGGIDLQGLVDAETLRG